MWIRFRAKGGFSTTTATTATTATATTTTTTTTTTATPPVTSMPAATTQTKAAPKACATYIFNYESNLLARGPHGDGVEAMHDVFGRSGRMYVGTTMLTSNEKPNEGRCKRAKTPATSSPKIRRDRDFGSAAFAVGLLLGSVLLVHAGDNRVLQGRHLRFKAPNLP